MRLYNDKQITELIDLYESKGGEIYNTDEGVLTSGNWILYDPSGRLKTFVITEVYLNEWSSAQKVRAYNKTPKKYLKMIENF